MSFGIDDFCNLLRDKLLEMLPWLLIDSNAQMPYHLSAGWTALPFPALNCCLSLVDTRFFKKNQYILAEPHLSCS